MKTDLKQMILNEAQILGHVEAKSPHKKRIADRLVAAGALLPGGRMSGGGTWYKPATEHAVVGPRVRFTRENLGASEPDDLTRIVADRYGVGDAGILVFEHPNRRLSADGWVYVEVDSKTGPARKLYAGVMPDMFEWVGAGIAEVLGDPLPACPVALGEYLAERDS